MNHLNVPIHPITDANFDISALAAVLARSDCDAQSTFFNEFVTQLQKACDVSKGSLGISMQCLWINKKLSRDARYVLSDIGTLE